MTNYPTDENIEFHKEESQTEYRIGSRLRAIMYDIYKMKCQYCHNHIPELNYAQIDHIIPQARGGRSTLDNLTLSCAPCNRNKSDLDIPMEFSVPLLGLARAKEKKILRLLPVPNLNQKSNPVQRISKSLNLAIEGDSLNIRRFFYSRNYQPEYLMYRRYPKYHVEHRIQRKVNTSFGIYMGESNRYRFDNPYRLFLETDRTNNLLDLFVTFRDWYLQTSNSKLDVLISFEKDFDDNDFQDKINSLKKAEKIDLQELKAKLKERKILTIGDHDPEFFIHRSDRRAAARVDSAALTWLLDFTLRNMRHWLIVRSYSKFERSIYDFVWLRFSNLNEIEGVINFLQLASTLSIPNLIILDEMFNSKMNHLRDKYWIEDPFLN